MLKVSDCPGYYVSEDGNVIGKRGRIMKGHIDHCGYREVLMTINGKSKNYLVHRLIAKAFVPNPNNYPQVNHKDGNKLNNRADNLEWCTRSYNLIHAYQNGLEKRVVGENHHAHKLNEDAVKYIRDNSNLGTTVLGKMFGVHRKTVLQAMRRETWKEVQ